MNLDRSTQGKGLCHVRTVGSYSAQTLNLQASVSAFFLERIVITCENDSQIFMASFDNATLKEAVNLNVWHSSFRARASRVARPFPSLPPPLFARDDYPFEERVWVRD